MEHDLRAGQTRSRTAVGKIAAAATRKTGKAAEDRRRRSEKSAAQSLKGDHLVQEKAKVKRSCRKGYVGSPQQIDEFCDG